MPQFFTVKELAEYLNLSTRSIYLMVQLEEIPYYKIKKAVRFDKTEINSWLKDMRKEPRFELENA